MTDRPRQPDVLLDGENPNTTSAEDVQHWVRVYAELVVAAMGLDRQLGEDGSPVVRERIDRWRRRLVYWRGRSENLAAGSARFEPQAAASVSAASTVDSRSKPPAA